MRISTPLLALTSFLAPTLTLAQAPSYGGDWGASSSTGVTTTYVAETTVTMTLLQVSTATMWSNASSTIPSYTPPNVDVSATPSVCLNCNASTGAAPEQGANLAVAAIAGMSVLLWGSL